MEKKVTRTPSTRSAAKKVHADEEIKAFRAVGRRKSAIARVMIKEGTGDIIVNEKEFRQYFPLAEYQRIMEAPLVITDTRSHVNISVKVIGGGKRGQADAVRHGIARALVLRNADLKKTMRSEGFLTRDPRVKERKKPGLKRARRAPQFSKR